MTSLSPLRLLAEKATPGPWWPDPDAAAIFAGEPPGEYISQVGQLRNAAYIAAISPSVVLALIAVAEAASNTARALDGDKAPETALMRALTALQQAIGE